MTTTQDNDTTQPNVFPAKWAKALKEMPEFKDICDAASVEDLKKIIVTSEGNIYTIEAAKAADVKLNATKELIKEYSAPYTDAMKSQMCKIKYALFCLESKGTELGDQESE
jgi:hypothetical protein